MPSRHEGLGVAALEAMAAGCPVIASLVGGMPEAVGDAAVLMPHDDAQALAEAIRRLALDRSAARALGEAGRRRVAERFTLAAMARGTRAVYRELVPATGAAA